MKKTLICLFIALCLCVPAQAADIMKLKVEDPQPFAEDEELMKVYFFRIQAQDSILIMCGGETMLVDGGTYDSGKVILKYLEYLGVDHIDYAVNTHPHDDHIDGFTWLMSNIPISQLLVCFPLNYNEQMERAVRNARANNVEIKSFGDKDDISFGGLTIRLYQDKKTTNTNYCSMVMHVSYKDSSVLLLADIGRPVHKRLYDACGSLLKSDIVKLPHHGTSVPGKEMLLAADPVVCVITNGNNRKVAETVKTVKSWKYPILFTIEGNIEFVTNGEYWTCKQYGR